MKNKNPDIKVSINGNEKNYTVKTNSVPEEANKNRNEDKRKESNNEFSWVIPKIRREEKEKKDNIISIQHYKKEKKKRKIPPIFRATAISGQDKKKSRILLAVIASLFIGLSLGFGFLKMMNTASMENANKNAMVSETPGTHSEVKLAERKLYLLQFGLFSEEERAKKALNGKAPFSFSIVQTEEGYRVYLGVFPDEKVQAYWGSVANQSNYEYINKVEEYKGKTLLVGRVEYKTFIEAFDVLFTDLLKVTSTFTKEKSISKEQYEKIIQQVEDIKKQEHLIANEPLLFEMTKVIKTIGNQIEAEYKEADIENKKAFEKSLLQLYSLYHELYTMQSE